MKNEWHNPSQRAHTKDTSAKDSGNLFPPVRQEKLSKHSSPHAMEHPIFEKKTSSLQQVSKPRLFFQLMDNLNEPSFVYEDSRTDGLRAAIGGGFYDLLEEAFGEGQFFNTYGSVIQLAMAISLSEHPAIPPIVASGGPEMINNLRRKKVLTGMKILDLGCGKLPSFALTAKALGAQVYTADHRQLDEQIRSQLDGHTMVNFNSPEAAQRLLEETGGNFTFVSENIIDGVPGDPSAIFYPGASSVKNIGEKLLAKNGWYFGDTSLFQQKKLPSSDKANIAMQVPHFQTTHIDRISNLTRDRFGNSLMVHTYKENDGSEKEKFLLVSRKGEHFFAINRNIIETIYQGVNLLTEQLNSGTAWDTIGELRLDQERKMTVHPEGDKGNQSFVFILETEDKRYIIKTRNQTDTITKAQPYTTNMLQAQEIQEEFSDKFKAAGLAMPTFLFATEDIACIQYEKGTHPDATSLFSKLWNINREVKGYIERQKNELWQDMDTDFCPSNFLIRNYPANYVWIDPFREKR